MSDPAFDVVVVGMGPVGALSANLLGARGIKTLIIDKESEIYSLPRAIAFDHDAMRILQSCGLTNAIETLIAPYAPSEYHGVAGKVISRFDMQDPPYPLGWAPNYVFRQPPFEAALRAGLRRFDCVEERVPREFLGFEQKDSCVQILMKNGQESESTTARYLLGADGGASTVRKIAGTGMTSLDFDEPWLVVDVLCSEAALKRLPSTIIQYCNPSRPATYVIGTENHRRWEIRLLEGEDPKAFEDESTVWSLLTPWLKPGDGKLWRWATYEFHAVIANTWRDRSTLLLGDAAHMTPPFMAQGMTQGFRDAANLVWKLERVLEGRASDSLLDTYMEERAPHVRATTEIAKGLGRVICEFDLIAAQERDAKMLNEFGDPPIVRSRQSLIPDLIGGLIFRGTNGAGTVFPQPFVQEQNVAMRFDDLVGPGPILVLRSSLNASVITPRIIEFCEELWLKCIALQDNDSLVPENATPVVEQNGLLEKWFSDHNCVAAIIRPDHYVYGTATNGSQIEKLCMAWSLSQACSRNVQNTSRCPTY